MAEPTRRLSEEKNEHGEVSPEPPFVNTHSWDTNKEPRTIEPSRPESYNQDELAQAEASPSSAANSHAVGSKEAQLVGNSVKKGLYNGLDNYLPPQARFTRIAAQLMTSRRAKVGGGIGVGTVMIFLITMSMSAVELVAIREEMLTKGNRLGNISMSEVNINTFARVSRQLQTGVFEDRFTDEKRRILFAEKFTEKMRANGFVVEFQGEGKNARLIRLAYEAKDMQGNVIGVKEYDLKGSAPGGGKSSSQATREFFGSDSQGIGRQAKLAFNKATGGNALTWQGRGANKFYGKIGLSKKNWLNTKVSEKAKTNKGKIASLVRPAQANESSYTKGARAPPSTSDQDTRPVDPDTGQRAPVDANGNPNETLDASTEADKAQGVGEKLLSEPDKSVSAITGTNENAGVFASTFSDLKDSQNRVDTALLQVGDNVPDSLKTSIGKSFQVTGTYYYACRLKGAMAFAENTRNVLLAYQLAKFAGLYLVAADHQKAGVANSEGQKIFMSYLHGSTDKNGKSYTQSGGFQNAIRGDPAARPGEQDLSKYSTGRGDDGGIIGDINQALNSATVAAVVSTAGCKVVNNTYVQIGSTVAGGALALFTGGTSSAGSLAYSISMSLAIEMVFQISERMLISSQTGILLDGHEGGEEVGSALGSGFSIFKGSINSVNGLRPIGVTAAAQLQKEADAEREFELAQMSVKERYFDSHNPDSVVANLAMSTPGIKSSLWRPATSLTGITNSINPAHIASRATSFGISNKVAFAASSDCSDPQVQQNRIQADVFCNPEIAEYPNLDVNETYTMLLNKGDIDQDGEPVSEQFKEYISNCHSGRPGILYKNTTSSNEEEQEKINQQIKTGQLDASQKNDDCFTNGESAGYTGGKFARFTNWYAYINSLDNLDDHVNERFGGSAQEEKKSEETVNPNIFIIGDSLTIGMRDFGGLETKLSQKGWEVTGIEATSGINVSDSIKKIDSNKENIQKSGTVLLALGTNKERGLKDEAEKMIKRIQSISPGVQIFWVNAYGGKDNYASTNENIAAAAKANNTKIIDWAEEARSNPEKYPWGDAQKIHHTPDGYEKKSAFIVRSIGDPPTESGTSGDGQNESAVIDDGYAFPIAAKKKSDVDDFDNSLNVLPCKSANKICHHDGSAAFDLGVKGYGPDRSQNAPVFAITDGTIRNVRYARDGNPCNQFQLVSKKDGYWYWYGHLALDKTVKDGMEVKAGQKIGKVGKSACADKTAPHLHIDRGYPKGRPGGSQSARDKGITDLINRLYEKLPD